MHHQVDIDGFPGSYALISENGATRTAAVFVHGFMGDASATWQDFQGLIDDDPATWGEVDLYFFRYDSFGRSISDSAGALGRFIHLIQDSSIELFSVAAPEGETYGPIAGCLFHLRSRKNGIKTLWLIGHSQGGLILRTLVRAEMKAALKGLPADLADAGKTPPLPLRGNVRLFAPAISGARPARLLGLALRFGGIGSVLRAVLGGSPAYQEMQQGSELLDVVRDDTTAWADDERYRHLTSLRAEVLWADRDDVVSDIEYRHDDVHPLRPAGSNHVSVCKPTGDYLLPLRFSSHGTG